MPFPRQRPQTVELNRVDQLMHRCFEQFAQWKNSWVCGIPTEAINKLISSVRFESNNEVHYFADIPSLSTCPSAHSAHSTSPHPAYVPLAHSVHSVAGFESSSARPEEQKSQLAEPRALYCPAWQLPHASKLRPPAV